MDWGNKMRRTFVAVAVLLAFTATAGEPMAKKPRSRSETQPYTTEQGGLLIISPLQSGVSIAQATFYSEPREKFMTVEIRDAHAPQVSGEIRFLNETAVDFCGVTDEPVPIPAGGEIEIALFSGTCGTSGPSAAIEGEITVTFASSAKQL